MIFLGIFFLECIDKVIDSLRAHHLPNLLHDSLPELTPISLKLTLQFVSQSLYLLMHFSLFILVLGFLILFSFAFYR
jgi:hypothetical protein